MMTMAPLRKDPHEYDIFITTNEKTLTGMTNERAVVRAEDLGVGCD